MFLSVFLHSFRWVLTPPGKEELLLTEELEEKQEKRAGSFTGNGSQKDSDYGDHVAL